MGDQSLPNYPDILGYISDNERHIISNVVDVAITVRPQIVKAGRAFSVIVLAQNLTDVSVQVFTVVELPPKDQNKEDQPFQSTSNTFQTTLYPAEVGYIVMPINSRLTAAPGDYRLSVEFYVRPKSKPRTIRDTKGVSSLDYYFYLSESTLSRMAKLKQLPFTGSKRGLFGSKALEINFKLEPGTEWKGTQKKPSWVSLWTMGEHTDGRALLERHKRTLTTHVFPNLTKENLYRPLRIISQQRIRAGGYDIDNIETHYIAKLIICLLQMSWETQSSTAVEVYHIAKNLKKPWPTDGTPIPLPRWCRVFLDRMDFDERFIAHPIDVLVGPLYGDLMYDAIEYGFHLMHTFTNVNLGTIYQINEYATQIVDMLWDPEADLDLVEIYVPLVLGGVLVDERVLIPNENKLENLQTLFKILESHKSEDDPDRMEVITMCEDVIHLVLKKYGYRMGRY